MRTIMYVIYDGRVLDRYIPPPLIRNPSALDLFMKLLSP